MRFFPLSRWLRITLTAVWSLVALAYLLHPREHPWRAAAWIVVAAIQIATLWTTFWESTPDALVQHGLFNTRSFIPWQALTYAGPVRRRGLLGPLLRRNLELATPNRPHIYINPGPHREQLLAALHQNAPHINIPPRA